MFKKWFSGKRGKIEKEKVNTRVVSSNRSKIISHPKINEYVNVHLLSDGVVIRYDDVNTFVSDCFLDGFNLAVLNALMQCINGDWKKIVREGAFGHLIKRELVICIEGEDESTDNPRLDVFKDIPSSIVNLRDIPESIRDVLNTILVDAQTITIRWNTYSSRLEGSLSISPICAPINKRRLIKDSTPMSYYNWFKMGEVTIHNGNDFHWDDIDTSKPAIIMGGLLSVGERVIEDRVEILEKNTNVVYILDENDVSRLRRNRYNTKDPIYIKIHKNINVRMYIIFDSDECRTLVSVLPFDKYDSKSTLLSNLNRMHSYDIVNHANAFKPEDETNGLVYFDTFITINRENRYNVLNLNAGESFTLIT